MELTGRDGNVRSYATFVTSTHLVTVRNGVGVFPTSFVLIPLVAFGAVFVFLLSRKRVTHRPHVRDLACHVEDVIDAAEDVATDLPDDPAEALASLHKSAEGIV